MKKLIGLKWVVGCLAVIALAGGGVWYWLNSTMDEAPVQVRDIETYRVGGKIILDQFTSFRVEQVQLSKAMPDAQPPDGMDWVNVQVTFETSTQPGVSIGNYDKYLRDASGRQYHYTETDITKAHADVSNGRFDLPLEGPATRTGWLGFAVPRHAQGLELVFKPAKFLDRTIVVPLNMEAN